MRVKELRYKGVKKLCLITVFGVSSMLMGCGSSSTSVSSEPTAISVEAPTGLTFNNSSDAPSEHSVLITIGETSFAAIGENSQGCLIKI